MDRHSPPRRTAGGRRHRLSGLVLALGAVVIAGCASFPDSQAAPFSAQATLTPAQVLPVDPEPQIGEIPSVITPQTSAGPGSASSGAEPPSSSSAAPSTSATDSPAPSTSGGSSVEPPATSGDPPPDCVPTDPAVIAECLAAPWGLVPLADGNSALVGERTTGRILKVAYQQQPVEIATIPDIDASGDGGLLGLAVSPNYAEDQLIYAYVTTATDNRIVRIAPGDEPKAIFTGIPKGATHNGGPIAFDSKSFLYVATGDAGDTSMAAAPTSLAGKVLRLDASGKPAGSSLGGDSPVYASGLTQPTGICNLASDDVAVVDHRTTSDDLLDVKPGLDLSSAGALWSWKPGEGGGNDCAISSDQLVNTSLDGQTLTSVTMTPQGAFSGTPQPLIDHTYGRLLTVEPGTDGLLWITTSNKDGHGDPVPEDDRVIVLRNSGGGGGDGPD